MFKKIENTWKLAKECWRILMLDKEMLVFPAFSAIFSISVLAAAYYGISEIGIFNHEKDTPYSDQQKMLGWPILCLTVFGLYFAVSFFHAALVASALKRLKGDNPTLWYGIRLAGQKLPQIAGWAFASILFGLLLAVIQNLFKSKAAQRSVGNVVESGWNILTIFVVPAILAENRSIYGAFKRSGSLVKKTWGEAIGLEFGFQWLGTLAVLPLSALYYFGYTVRDAYPTLTILLWIVSTILLIGFCMVYSALNGISKAAIYNFAIDGDIPEGFDRNVLGNAISS